MAEQRPSGSGERAPAQETSRQGRDTTQEVSAQVSDTDFSVVLFRPNFMLASEEHPMKAHKNQWFLTMPSPPAIPCGGTNQGDARCSGVQAPS